MKILISSIGSTDPIRSNHDGPLLHIARVYRPEKIVLVFSDKMSPKKDRVVKALNTIEGYYPEIIIDKTIIPSNEVSLFDKMYETFLEIVTRYREIYLEDEFYLNLSSATPQIISALFSINRINDFNVHAVQVSTPTYGPNEKVSYSNDTPIELEIESNLDNREDFVNRIIEDHADKFSQSLTKRNIRVLIEQYDYQAAYDIVIKKENKGLLTKKNSKLLRNTLEDVIQVFKKQSTLSKLDDIVTDEEQKRIINYILMIDILNRRGLIADVLIKSKSIVERLLENYINLKLPGLIISEDNKPRLNQNHIEFDSIQVAIVEGMKKTLGNKFDERIGFNPDSILNLLSLINIIEYIEPESEIISMVQDIQKTNSERNKVAHGLAEIDIKLVSKKRLNNIVKSLKSLYQLSYPKESEKIFTLYDKLNEEILCLLK